MASSSTTTTTITTTTLALVLLELQLLLSAKMRNELTANQPLPWAIPHKVKKDHCTYGNSRLPAATVLDLHVPLELGLEGLKDAVWLILGVSDKLSNHGYSNINHLCHVDLFL